MSSALPQLASYRDFASWIAKEIDVVLPDIESSRFDDLGLDSVDRMEVLLLVEEVGVSIPESIATEIEGLDEVYEYVRGRSDARRL